jgi:hypothetical protein
MDAIVYSFEAVHRSQVISLIGVIENDIQDDFDPGFV